jgi:hypothetical protein
MHYKEAAQIRVDFACPPPVSPFRLKPNPFHQAREAELLSLFHQNFFLSKSLVSFLLAASRPHQIISTAAPGICVRAIRACATILRIRASLGHRTAYPTGITSVHCLFHH